MLLNIPDSAKVVAFKPEHPGLWSIKVGPWVPGRWGGQFLVAEMPSPSCLPWGAEGWRVGGGVGIAIEAKGQGQRGSTLLCTSKRRYNGLGLVRGLLRRTWRNNLSVQQWVTEPACGSEPCPGMKVQKKPG